MTINDFISAMKGGGIVCNEHIVSDGQIHRFCNTRRGKKDGWYISFNDGQFGAYGDWFLNINTKYSNGSGKLTREEIEAIEREIEQSKQKKLVEQGEVAQQAINKLEGLFKEGHSEYLIKKQVKSYGIFFDSLAVAIPIRDINGKIWSLQYIYADGTKRFLKGGKKKACFHTIGKFPSDKVVLCEGYATGASIYEATGITTLVCFDAYNIPEVAKLLKCEVIVAADNDKVGIEQANKTGYEVIYPKQEGFDFNDVHHEYGLHGVKNYFISEETNIIYPHGLIGEIARWISDTAYVPQPVLSIAAALAAVSTIKAHRVQASSGTRTNLYVLSLAPSGGGKQHPINCIDVLFSINDRLEELIMGKLASGAGLIDGLHHRNGRAIIPIDEAGNMLSAILSQKAGIFQREIIDIFIELFQKTNSKYRGKQYALSKENKERRDINQPCLSIIGTTVPEKLYDGLDSTSIIDGFLNRWLVFETKDEGELQDGDINLDIPPHIKQQIIDILNIPTNSNNPGCLFENEINPKVVEFTEEASEYFETIKKEVKKIAEPMRKNKDPLLSMWIRVIDHIRKVALIVCDNEFIRLEDVKWAKQTVFICIRQACENCMGISDNQNEKELLGVLKIIKDNAVISRSDLTRKTQSLTSRRRKEILEDLIVGERIEVIQEESKFKKKVSYKFIK